MTPTFRFRVCAEGDGATVKKGEIACVIGRDVQVDARALEDYCFQLLSSGGYELTLLAGVIAFVDRSVRRRHSDGWARRIEIIMPVHDPEDWERCRAHLQELLQFLTGDFWNISFIGRRSGWGNVRQDIFKLGRGSFVVVPYSNGLDSFAQSQMLKLSSSQLTPIRITTWNHALAGDRDWKTDPDGTKYRRVSVPVKIATSNHPEPTFRTRSFLFYVFAGIAAHLANAECVIIPENGQGSLGPSIVPFGAESPHRGSHPALTRRLGEFLGLVFGQPVQFQHPQLWRTKGEVLRILKNEKLLDGWTLTTSCPRDRRDVNLNGKLVQCGVCAGCLLRRTAAYVSELVEPEDTYLWPDLRTKSLEEALHPKSDRATRANDYDIAAHGVLVMSELARWADSQEDDPELCQCAFEISGAGALSKGLGDLRRLLKTHRAEWHQFRTHFGPKSWINSSFAFL